MASDDYREWFCECDWCGQAWQADSDDADGDACNNCDEGFILCSMREVEPRPWHEPTERPAEGPGGGRG